MGIAGQPSRAPEPSDHELKRWEEFYKYAQDSYQRAHDRWSAADEKASKYLSILGIVIGAGAVTSGQVAQVFARASTYTDMAFMGFYVAGAGFAIAAFACFLAALQLQDSSAPPTRPEMLDFFARNYYVDVLYGLGRDTLAAADATRIAVDRKFRAADTGFQLTRLAGICLLVASVAYFASQVRNARQTDSGADAAVSSVNEPKPDDAGPDGARPQVRPPTRELRGTPPAAPGAGQSDGIEMDKPE